MRQSTRIGMWLLAIVVVAGSTKTFGQNESPSKNSDEKQLYGKFSDALNNSALVGHFTIDGQTNKRHEERYEIKAVKKLPTGDMWLFTTRIKYGKHDVTLPIPLNVKWADKTPVITLDQVVIPLLGTFNARVIIDGKRYAGTWQHGSVGGHLFGRIEKMESSVQSDSKASDVQR